MANYLLYMLFQQGCALVCPEAAAAPKGSASRVIFHLIDASDHGLFLVDAEFKVNRLPVAYGLSP